MCGCADRAHRAAAPDRGPTPLRTARRLRRSSRERGWAVGGRRAEQKKLSQRAQRVRRLSARYRRLAGARPRACRELDPQVLSSLCCAARTIAARRGCSGRGHSRGHMDRVATARLTAYSARPPLPLPWLRARAHDIIDVGTRSKSTGQAQDPCAHQLSGCEAPGQEPRAFGAAVNQPYLSRASC